MTSKIRDRATGEPSPSLRSKAFVWNRVVVDEFTYLNGREATCVSNLDAQNRWVLSATPPTDDLYDIKSISRFLGIRLGPPAILILLYNNY